MYLTKVYHIVDDLSMPWLIFTACLTSQAARFTLAATRYRSRLSQVRGPFLPFMDLAGAVRAGVEPVEGWDLPEAESRLQTRGKFARHRWLGRRPNRRSSGSPSDRASPSSPATRARTYSSWRPRARTAGAGIRRRSRQTDRVKASERSPSLRGPLVQHGVCSGGSILPASTCSPRRRKTWSCISTN
jgi:hypothetical protein